MNEITWVVIEVDETSGTPQATAEPPTLHLTAGTDCTIVWYVFTPGFELTPDDGVVLPGPFASLATPDPKRPNCWTATLRADPAGQYRYGINYRRTGDDSRRYYHDPVIENDPPPTSSGIQAARGRAQNRRRSGTPAIH